MQIRVDSGLWLPGDAPPRLVELFARQLTFDNPAYVQAVRSRRHPLGIAPTISLLTRVDGYFRAPRGSVEALQRVCSVEGLRPTFDDRRRCPPVLGPLPAVALRDYQVEGVRRLRLLTQGLAVVPAGGGKTRLALGAIADLRLPTLVLVGSIDLAEQWRDQLRQVLGIEAALTGDGEAATGDVTVALVQALSHWDTTRLDVWLARFGLCILDEAHHAASVSFRAVIDRCPAKYRLALTATPEREDGLTPLLEHYFGPTLIAVTHDELIARGLLAVPRVRRVPTAFVHDYRLPKDYPPMMDALVADADRLTLVTDEVVANAHPGSVALVLSARVGHCAAIDAALRDRGLRTRLLTGRLKRSERTEILDQAKRGDLDVVVATTIADEGLDLPRLSQIYLAYPAKARGRTEQRLGRIMRPHPGKPQPLVVDFVDERIPLLRRQAAVRRGVFADVLGVTPKGRPSPRSENLPTLNEHRRT